MNNSKRLFFPAAAVLVLGLLGLAAWYVRSNRKPESAPRELFGLVGGEKMGVMSNPEIQGIILKEANLKYRIDKAPSVEMVDKVTEKVNFIFPGSQIPTEFFKASPKAGMLLQTEFIFNSPLVIYSWDVVAEHLMKMGIVQLKDQVYYVVDLPRLVKLSLGQKTWAEIGMPDIYGPVSIFSTNPVQSNSGLMFAGLLANVQAGKVADERSIEPHLGTIKEYFRSLGYLENTSDALFSQYLSNGALAKPLVVGYENQMIEYAVKNPGQWNQHKQKVRVLYPRPTVMSVHQILALSPEAQDLIKIMQDPRVQQIAWKQHGFRSAVPGVVNDQSVLDTVSIPAEVQQVMPLPNTRAMTKLYATLKE